MIAIEQKILSQESDLKNLVNNPHKAQATDNSDKEDFKNKLKEVSDKTEVLTGELSQIRIEAFQRHKQLTERLEQLTINPNFQNNEINEDSIKADLEVFVNDSLANERTSILEKFSQKLEETVGQVNEQVNMYFESASSRVEASMKTNLESLWKEINKLQKIDENNQHQKYIFK